MSEAKDQAEGEADGIDPGGGRGRALEAGGDDVAAAAAQDGSAAIAWDGAEVDEPVQEAPDDDRDGDHDQPVDQQAPAARRVVFGREAIDVALRPGVPGGLGPATLGPGFPARVSG